MGKAEVEGALQRLDVLTQEESLMAVARTFETTHHVDNKVTVIEEVLQQVDGNITLTQELTHHVNDNVMEVQELTCDVHADVEAIKEGTRTIDDNVKVTKGGAFIFQFLHTYTDHRLLYTVIDDIRRSSLPDIIINHCS